MQYILCTGLVFLLLRALCIAAVPSQDTSPVEISTSIGSFRGIANVTSGLEVWRGVPFAQPPVGKLRFKAPASITRPFEGVQDASSFGPACPQPVGGSTVGVSIEEDCLFLNIYRPEKTTAGSKLPVLVWIYGGSYNTGAASDPSHDPTLLINRSVHIGKPIIFVSLNYRVNTFGFLASSEVDGKDLNAGLLDQQAALKFIQDEISNFGGDSDKVTIWGQSAGGGGVEAQVIYSTGKPLFRAAIADSSAGPFHSSPTAAQFEEPGMPYARLVELAGCPSGSKSLACLENAPFETLLNATNFLISVTLNSQLWYPAVGPPDSFVPVRASQRIEAGEFRHISMIMGTNLNDGTIFSQSVLGLPKMNASAETARFDEFIAENIPNDITLTSDVLDGFHKLYPANDPTLGGRFNTGDSLYDRSEAWFTDQMYLSARRFFFDNAATLQPLFGYLFDEFYPGGNPDLGVFHGSELELIFGGAPASEESLATAFTDAYINFVTHLNPGSFWPQFNLKDQQILQWMKDNITAIRDDFNVDRTNFITSAKVMGEFEK
ncbi:alpha/beta-hydrolase [Ramaria rubella]|nr:alpha/beta-hydrolase [Ramaria rubella]